MCSSYCRSLQMMLLNIIARHEHAHNVGYGYANGVASILPVNPCEHSKAASD